MERHRGDTSLGDSQWEGRNRTCEWKCSGNTGEARQPELLTNYFSRFAPTLKNEWVNEKWVGHLLAIGDFQNNHALYKISICSYWLPTRSFILYCTDTFIQ